MEPSAIGHFLKVFWKMSHRMIFVGLKFNTENRYLKKSFKIIRTRLGLSTAPHMPHVIVRNNLDRHYRQREESYLQTEFNLFSLSEKLSNRCYEIRILNCRLFRCQQLPIVFMVSQSTDLPKLIFDGIVLQFSWNNDGIRW